MPDLAKYVVALEAETRRYQQGLERANAKLAKFDKDQRTSLKVIGDGFVQLGATVAGFAASFSIASKFTEVAKETQSLKAQLITATGSIDNAGVAFDSLAEFAAKTPFALEQSVNAFTRLTNLGLTPSQRAMMSYGNTASAMGKNLMQMVEAVADASVGEFERLKEFGIKASKEGDQVAFRFGSTTTMVKNDAASIEEFLIKLGETEFAGGLELQSKTLGGAISNLGDTWDATFRVINDSGIGESLVQGIQDAEMALGDFNDALTAYLGKGRDVTPITDTLLWLFRQLAKAGLYVAKTFEKVGSALGGLAASASLALSGDFGAAGAVLDEIEVQAAAIEARFQAALAELNATGGDTGAPKLPSDKDDPLKNFKKGGDGSGATEQSDQAKAIARLNEEITKTQMLIAQNPELGNQIAALLLPLDDMNALSEQAAQDALEIQQEYNAALLEVMRQATSTTEATADAVFVAIDEAAKTSEAAAKEHQAALEKVEGQIVGLFEQNLVQAADGSFDAILDSWVLTIKQMVAKALASKLFELFAGTSFGGQVAGLISGARAHGGPVTGGRAYLVGERGPELFVPRGSGSVVANGAIAAPRIVINTPPGVVSSTEQRMSQGEMLTIINQAIEQKVTGDISQGTGIARALEGRYGLRR